MGAIDPTLQRAYERIQSDSEHRKRLEKRLCNQKKELRRLSADLRDARKELDQVRQADELRRAREELESL